MFWYLEILGMGVTLLPICPVPVGCHHFCSVACHSEASGGQGQCISPLSPDTALCVVESLCLINPRPSSCGQLCCQSLLFLSGECRPALPLTRKLTRDSSSTVLGSGGTGV